MRFTVGQDPETNEYLVGDTQTMHIILRGPASEWNSIRELVDAANGLDRQYFVSTRAETFCQHQRLNDNGDACLDCHRIRGENGWE